MFTISKTFSFSASHQLNGLAAEHPCSRLHGHNYTVTVTLCSPTPSLIGFVYDYREMDGLKQYIDNELDHRHLNDIVKFNPTAELLAEWLYEQFQKQFTGSVKLKSITVKETEKTSATYEP